MLCNLFFKHDFILFSLVVSNMMHGRAAGAPELCCFFWQACFIYYPIANSHALGNAIVYSIHKMDAAPEPGDGRLLRSLHKGTEMAGRDAIAYLHIICVLKIIAKIMRKDHS